MARGREVVAKNGTGRLIQTKTSVAISLALLPHHLSLGGPHLSLGSLLIMPPKDTSPPVAVVQVSGPYDGQTVRDQHHRYSLHLTRSQIKFPRRIYPCICPSLSSTHAQSLILKVQEDLWKIPILSSPRSMKSTDRVFLPSLTGMQASMLQSGVDNTSMKYVHLSYVGTYWRTDFTGGYDSAPSSTPSSTFRRR
jgi:hypothetical protein